MIVLNRINDKVYFDGKELKINKQETKGPNKEVVSIDGLPGSNGQKWISLSKLKEGLNEVETKRHERTTSNKKYELTDDEQRQIDEYQAKIDAIIEGARARYIEKPNLNIKVENLSNDEVQRQIDLLNKYIQNLKDNLDSRE